MFQVNLFTLIFGASIATVVLPWLTSVVTPSEVPKLRQKKQETRADVYMNS